MFLLAFAIGMVVAFIIKMSVRGVEFSQNIRDEKYHNEMKRLRSIRRIRNDKNASRMRKIEESSNNNILNYYYGKYNRKKDSTSGNDTNELIEHYYGKI
jgi:hypothetical protein